MTNTGNERSITVKHTAQRPSADEGTTFATPEDHHHVAQNAAVSKLPAELPPESGGQAGPEPTRYGDWEKKGRCTDF